MENDDFSMVGKNVASSHPSLAYASTGASSCNDDLSIFLHQILRSSLSSAIAFSGERSAFSFSSSSPSRISGTTSNNMASTEVNRHSSPPALAGGSISAITSSIGICDGPKAENSCSFLFGANESDPDQDDCQREDPKRFMGELPVKSIKCRSFKRSRAAEVHNLSEKRRRSKINEKMKALQNLIPNSNKTDKASMLEEAIEYLKQLQLRVQILTFRSGLRLRRAGAEQLPNTIIDFGEIREPLHLAMPDKSQMNQDRPPNPLSNLPVACSNLTDLLCPRVDGSSSEASPGIEHSTKAHAGSFHLHPFTREEINGFTLLHDLCIKMAAHAWMKEFCTWSQTRDPVSGSCDDPLYIVFPPEATATK